MTNEKKEREQLREEQLHEEQLRETQRPAPGDTDLSSSDLSSSDLSSSDLSSSDLHGTDDEYLLTAYLFGDITREGRDEVERRIETSKETRAELEKLRSTKLLIEDALKAPLEENDSTPGRKVDPQELAALLRERQRARRRKTVISVLSIAATVVICATFVSVADYGGNSTRGVGITNVSQSAPELEAGSELAYAPKGGALPKSDLDAGSFDVAARDKQRFDSNERYAFKGAPEAREPEYEPKLKRRIGRSARVNAKGVPRSRATLGLETPPPPSDTPDVAAAGLASDVDDFEAAQLADEAPEVAEGVAQSELRARAPAKPATGTVTGPRTYYRANEKEQKKLDEDLAAPRLDHGVDLLKDGRGAASREKDTIAFGEDAEASRRGEPNRERLGPSKSVGAFVGEFPKPKAEEQALNGLATQLGRPATQRPSAEPAARPEEEWEESREGRRSRDYVGNAEAARPEDPLSHEIESEAAGTQIGDGWRRQGQSQQALQGATSEQARRWAQQHPEADSEADVQEWAYSKEASTRVSGGGQKVERGLGELSKLKESLERINDLTEDAARARGDLGDLVPSETPSPETRSSSGRAAGQSSGTEDLTVTETAAGEPRDEGEWGDFKANAPDSATTAERNAPAGIAGGKLQSQAELQQQVRNFARRGGAAQTPSGPGGSSAADGTIIPKRASQVADLVNRQQLRLFEAVPDVPTGGRARDVVPSTDWLSRVDAGYQSAQREIGPLEKELRAYAHYRSLDPQLTLDTYSAQPLDVPPPVVGDENLGRDAFRERYGVNPFVDTRHDHFSTFSMDVDTASFTRARERIRSGELPEPSTVRVEEFVNYFPQDCAPDPENAFSVCTEGGPAPFGPGLDLLKITVKARELRPNERKKAVLTFAIDTSGSMHMENSLDLMRDALESLIASLRPDDQVAVVAYNANAYVVLPHTPAREKESILAELRALKAGGGTNVQGGLDLAYRLADEVIQPKAVNRVILCSDGVANVGARDPKDVLEKVKVFARRGIYLSVVGFGKKRYNDAFLERLANEGNGNYTYVADLNEARAVFANNLPRTLEVLAEDAKIQLDFDPEVVTHYRLLGYENRDIADKDFRNDKIDAAEVGPGTTVTVLFELRRKPGSHGDLGRLFIRYRDTGTRQVDELDFPLPPGVLETSAEATSATFRFTACAAETAELLRHSYWARDGSFGRVLEELYHIEESFRARPEWRELAQLVTEAQRLAVIQLAGEAAR